MITEVTETHRSFLKLQDSGRYPKYQDMENKSREIVEVEAMLRCGIPYDYAIRTFDGHYPNLEPTLKGIATPPVDRWVLFAGATGSGKTSLLANMARRLFKIWAIKTSGPAYQLPSNFADRVRFVKFTDFRDIIRSGYDDAISAGAQGIDLFNKIHLLLLDDMIDGDNKPYDYLRLHDVINHRYDAGSHLPMWISTNVNDADMRKIPDFGRSYSRLADSNRCQWTDLGDEDRRS